MVSEVDDQSISWCEWVPDPIGLHLDAPGGAWRCAVAQSPSTSAAEVICAPLKATPPDRACSWILHCLGSPANPSRAWRYSQNHTKRRLQTLWRPCARALHHCIWLANDCAVGARPPLQTRRIPIHAPPDHQTTTPVSWHGRGCLSLPSPFRPSCLSLVSLISLSSSSQTNIPLKLSRICSPTALTATVALFANHFIPPKAFLF